jgi:rhodanese-related sulfurtransferase
MLTVNNVRAILSFARLSEVELERLALSAAGAHLVRSQWYLKELTDPTRRILVYCEFGRVSTLATATLRQMGFHGAGGVAWSRLHGKGGQRTVSGR